MAQQDDIMQLDADSTFQKPSPRKRRARDDSSANDYENDTDSPTNPNKRVPHIPRPKDGSIQFEDDYDDEYDSDDTNLMALASQLKVSPDDINDNPFAPGETVYTTNHPKKQTILAQVAEGDDGDVEVDVDTKEDISSEAHAQAGPPMENFSDAVNANVAAFLESKVDDDGVQALAWSSDDQMGSDDDDDDDDDDYGHDDDGVDDDQDDEFKQEVFLPTQMKGDPTQMEHINEAYTCFHPFNTEWPCLSFDILRDGEGAMRTKVPYTMYLACGTQADQADKNEILFLKLSQLQKTKYDSEPDSDADENDPDYLDMTDEQAVLQDRSIKHPGGVNRLRSMPQHPAIVATWSDDTHVYVFDGQQHVKSLDGQADDITRVKKDTHPVFSQKHLEEGFALSWSPNDEGWLLTGSCCGELKLLQPRGGSWKATKKFTTGKESIEDISWKPRQQQIFISVGCDRHILVWDLREKKHVRCINYAHESDINVVSWNPHQEHLILTGSDDKSFSVWDMRQCPKRKFASKTKVSPYAHYQWHTAPITSVEWHPMDEAQLCVSSEDHQITLWDLSAEIDESGNSEGAHLTSEFEQKLPPQMMFVHSGQKDIKEVHWHPQIPNMLVSTAASGFHVFKPDNLTDSFENLTLA